MQAAKEGGVSLLMLSLLICTVTFHPVYAYEEDYIKNFGTFHFDDNGPVQEPIDVRVSLWSSGMPLTGETNPDGSINTSSENYGDWQHVMRITPDINGDFGFNVFNNEYFPDLPEIFSYNSFLQAEFKYTSEPETAYRRLDLLRDSPDRIKRWLLVDTLTCLDPLLKHIGTINNEFSLDADGNSNQFVKLFFGGNSDKALAYDLLSNWFNINSRLNINGFSGIKLAINAHSDDTGTQLFSIRNSSGQTKFFVDETGAATAAGLSIPSTSGSKISGHYSSLTVNVISAAIPAGQCANYASLSLNGAEPGQTVLATPLATTGGIETTHLGWNAFSDSSDHIVIRACNPSSSEINTADQQSWRIDVWTH
jgi:hypothetical protein